MSMSFHITFIQNSTRTPIQSNETRKMNWDHMTRLYQKLLELINKIGSLAEYNINIKKQLSLYTVTTIKKI